jgi:hypothetical protein
MPALLSCQAYNLAKEELVSDLQSTIDRFSKHWSGEPPPLSVKQKIEDFAIETLVFGLEIVPGACDCLRNTEAIAA